MEYNYPGKVVHYDELPKLMNDYNKGVGMKVYVYKSNGDALAQSLVKSDILCVNHVEYNYLGELDLDIQQPKKTVRKEVHCSRSGNFEWQASQFIPTIAKNIKITYEVDE
jgi:hypothetical protein